MENELISKKEILEVTGISYGQLYRWKRKNLIPEEWFIKKSSFTGQETFFPRAKILDRIDKILNMKDDLSLDDIATMFSPQLAEIFLGKDDLIQKNIVSKTALDIYESYFGEVKTFPFQKVLFISILEKFLRSGEIAFEEGKIILQNLEDNYKNFKEKQSEIIFIRKFGIGTCLLISYPNDIYIEKTAKLVLKINIGSCVEELKLKI